MMDQRVERPATANVALVIGLCCLVAAFEGIDLQAPGLTVPVLAPLFQMTAGSKGLFLSISTFGMIVGAAIGGRVSDGIGRKAVLIAAVSLFGLLTIATAFSSSVEALLVTRLFTGVGLGGALPNVIALVTENATTDRRSTAIGFLYASLPCGGAIASVIATLASGRDQWQVVYLIGGIAPLVLVPLLASILRNPQPDVGRTGTPSGSGVIDALFGERRRYRTLVLWSSFFLALLTMYLLLGWLPSFMGSRGLTRPQASAVQIAFNACGALGSILTGSFLDRGKRSVVVTLVFLSALGSVALLIEIPAKFAVALMAGGLVGAMVSGTQAILYDLAPRGYPVMVRGTGVGFAVAMGRLGSAVGPLWAGLLLSDGFKPAQVLESLIPMLALSGIGAVVMALDFRRPAA